MSHPLQSPALVIDAATPRVTIGLVCRNGEERLECQSASGESGTLVFEIVEALLTRHQLLPGDVRTIAFCDGPGSILGIRIAAIAIRTWMALGRTRPLDVFAYHSLALVAADLVDGGVTAPFSIVTDARRNAWNLLEVRAEGTIDPVRRVDAAHFPAVGTRCFRPEAFPLWQPIREGVEVVPYRPERLLRLASRFALLVPVDAPEAFLTETPTYTTWSGTAHQAASAR